MATTFTHPPDNSPSKELKQEISRRRTFAIISHPDAGKTTLTEKLLLYAGAVEAAGSVRPKKQQSHATSDWMAMEQARGISITSTVLQFEHEGCLFNLLDTPGHQDFSEDTYRTLTAVDSAVMVLDGAKGIEPQTRKLFEVCRMRQIPILTFVNKMDQPGLEPLELLDEIEKVLGIVACPINWPVGYGPQFRGVANLESRRFLRYTRSTGGQFRSLALDISIDDPEFEPTVGSENARHLGETSALLRGVIPPFEKPLFLSGRQTPVFFGSALNNFGVDCFLKALVDLAPSPRARISEQRPVDPLEPRFSAFIFKIQGNMDPMHRDSMAFLRICSGRFERDMLVHHPRLGKKVRMTRLHRLFARGRQTVDEAFAGDVVGVVNPGMFAIGDTLSDSAGIEFQRMPSFQPEHFGVLHNDDVSRSKQFRKGVIQLAEEGVVQVYYDPAGVRREPILGAVGRLQFDVVESRLFQEYGVRAGVDSLPYTCARWPQGTPEALARVRWPSSGVALARDQNDRMVCLFSSKWELQSLTREYPEVQFSETS
ncbi:MAG: peptide chain release factor 3 [Acidobacteria bacterium]|nr:peptide chain release factor 3 [Acidobacteriota bacterium]